MIFSWKKFIIGLLIIFIDLIIYVFLGLMLMQYDDFYDESKGEYMSLNSMTTFDKVAHFSLMTWNIINAILIIFIIYKFIKQIRTHHFVKNQ